MADRELEPQRVRPVFAVVSLFCVVLALPLAKLVIALIPQKEDLLGYGAVGVAMLVIIGCLIFGFPLGLVGVFRRETPRVLPALATAANGLPLCRLVSHALFA